MKQSFRSIGVIRRTIAFSIAVALFLTIIGLSVWQTADATGVAAANTAYVDADRLTDPSEQPRSSTDFGRVPLSFEINRGQTAKNVEFLSRGAGYTLFLNQARAVLSLTKQLPDAANSLKPTVITLELVGANPAAKPHALDELPGKHNYIIGNDSAKWQIGLPTFERVNFRDVYKGVDLVYYGNQRELEYDFIVAANADAEKIRWGISDGSTVGIDADGQLVIQTKGSSVRMKKPIAYQTINGEHRSVAASYVLFKGKKADQIGFSLGEYDRGSALVIDPVVVFSSSLLDGSGADSANDIAVDPSGNAYVTGNTASINFPTVNPIQATLSGGQDAFISKYNAAGTALIYSTYLGGSSGFENGWDIAVDAAGNAYVAGRTTSIDFPVTAATAFQATKTTNNTVDGGFVTKLNANGTLGYSTYLFGPQGTSVFGVATDGVGNAYVTGRTGTGFPITASAFDSTNFNTGFLTKLNTNAAGAASLVYSTYLGSSGFAEGHAIAVDSTGNAYVTGRTSSTAFSTPGAFQTTYGGGTSDAFVEKFNTNLSGSTSRVYSTYLGGSGQDFGGQSTPSGSKAIAIDTAGNAYITGFTTSTNFPTANAFQGANAGNTDAFLTKLNPAGSALVYSTYLGGSGASSDDEGKSVAVNVAGNAYVVGLTASSTNFPTAFPLGTADGTTGGAFLAKFAPAGNTVVYSTRFGAVLVQGLGLALDGAGNAFTTSVANSATTVNEIADPTVIGRVVDEDGNPISGAIVNLTGVPAGPTLTDSNGFYTFGLLTLANSYTVSVTVPNYIFLSQPVNNLVKNVRLDFSPVVFSVSGQVTSCSAALSDVNVALTDGKSLTRTTDGAGNYSFANLPAGRNYSLTPSFGAFIFTPPNSSISNLSANQTLSFTGRPTTASISGRVATPAGQGLRNAIVSLIDSQSVRRTATTSSFGQYSFTGVPTGDTFTLTVASKRYRFAPQILPLQCSLTNLDFAGLE